MGNNGGRRPGSGRKPTFNAEQKAEIIKARIEEGLTLRELAKRFGGSRDSIHRVVGTSTLP